MKKIFFYIDRTNKQIRFIHYPIDRKGNMIGETEQYSSISFDDILTMTEERSWQNTEANMRTTFWR